ncbi:ClpX C4-type zinc finger protein [Hyalangium versicolor]|uniref:ClpX C4-type zinc finger protein n=1 Tax=Hyalangium versicolor TaxID=2861190 RepID=UPI001CCB88AC|nr:ClpX C4-type zinc finger protein [Hyalangium versicolor]
MANPREHIRAAQAAELRADKAGAIAELCKAAELYRQSGNLVRALQLLRHAQSLDPSRDDVAEELIRLEMEAEESSAGASPGEDFESGGRVRELRSAPEELAERQRLIDAALRQQEGVSGDGGEAEDEVKRWSVEAGANRPVDLQDASRRALDWALRNAQEEERAPREWSVEEEDSQGDLELRPVAEPEPRTESPRHPGSSVTHAAASVALEVRPLVEGGVTALVADVQVDSYEAVSSHSVPPEFGSDSEEGTQGDGERAEERSLIERGPTRADPAIDAWCSFCCRPGVEVGELVAGPTGSFICAGCVMESRGLLSLEDMSAVRPRASRRKEAQGEGMPFIGQQEARALLERALEAGARRLLVVGPEGCGKTVWFRELAREDRGTIATLDTLEQGGGGSLVLVEDVERYMPEDWARLSSLIARYPERTVLMSARGTLEAPSFVLHGASGSLPVFTTSALSAAVLDSVPLELLEQVQVSIPLQVPTEVEFLEIARRRLALRGSELALSEPVLAAFAAEAVRSPRAGHELSALLTRVLAGSWSLAGEEKKARTKKVAGKGAATKPGRRGRRKGSV